MPLYQQSMGGAFTPVRPSFADDFDRPDGSLFVAPWSEQFNGVNFANFFIRSNAVGPDDQFSSRRGAVYTGVTWSADHSSEIQALIVDTDTHLVGATVRCSTTQDRQCYIGGFDSSNFGNKFARIMRQNGASVTSLGVDTTTTIATGDRVRLEVVGTTLKLYVNDVLKVQATDTTYLAGVPGFQGSWSSKTNLPCLDNWRGVDFQATKIRRSIIKLHGGKFR
jgi:hypothetical protein